MSEIKKGTLGDILSASQIITADDIAAALDEQKQFGCRFGEALVRLGIVTQEDIDWALSNQLDIPYVRLKQAMIDPAATTLVPAAMARAYNCIPLIEVGGELSIALADPLNKPAIEAIEQQTGCRVNVSVALIREIREMIDAFYGSEQQASLGFSSTVFSEDSLAGINADASARTLMDALLNFIVQNRLTSLSLQPIGDLIRISGKRAGLTKVVGSMPPRYYPELCLRLRTAAAIPPSGSRAVTGSLVFSYHIQPVAFQVAVVPGEGGDYITLCLHGNAQIPSRLAVLYLPEAQQPAFSGLVRAAHGITFFASRNSQERDRFMDLMLEEMDTAGKNVIILGEGPGRMLKRFPRIPLPEAVSERARLILDILDHDPDILVIDEVSEGPVFSAACRAAMHGKLVLGGLELRGTRAVLQHLLLYQQSNLFLPAFVNGLISFAGVQLLCPSCRTEYQPPREELAAMRLEPPLPVFYHAGGCDACGYRGFSERRFLLDVITFDERFRLAFEQAANVAALDDALRQDGHCGFEIEGLRLLAAGEISPEEYISSIMM